MTGKNTAASLYPSDRGRQLCPIALVFYDHLITVKYEADFLRNRKTSAAAWIFLSNRYLLLAWALVNIVPFSPQASRSAY